jgi:branched-chain amino acid transport system permease protein
MMKVGAIGLLIFSITVPSFVKDPYFLNVGVVIFLNCILAVVLLPVFNSGLFCVATAAFMAIGGYTSALLVMRLGMNFWLALPISASAAGLIAALFGIPTFRIKGLYFLLLTLSFNEVTGLAIKNWRSLTGGADGISRIPSPNTISIFGLKIDFTSPLHYYYLALILALVVVLIINRLWRSRIGKICHAIQSAEPLAQSIGVSIFRHKMMIFIIYAFFTGLAGSFYAHFYSFLSPADFTIWASVYPIIYFQVGGISSVAGPIIGSIILTVISELIRSLSTFQPIAFGVIIIIVMRFIPEGMIGIFTRLAGKIK